MIELSNADVARILDCLDIAAAHYGSMRGLRNTTHAWAINRLKDKINRKINRKNFKTNERT